MTTNKCNRTRCPRPFGFGSALLAASMVLALPRLSGAGIAQGITTATVTLPQTLEPNRASPCTWGFCTLGPRLYLVPLADGRILLGWSDAAGNGHVSRINGTTIEQTTDFPARLVRGLVGHDDGSFAVLLVDRRGASPTDNVMVLSQRTAAGAESWATDLVNTFPAVPQPADGATYVAGDSRLVYGGGLYGAYFSVRSFGTLGEHDGEQYTIVNDSGAIQPGGYSWGLSHSLAGLIGYHPETGQLARIGVSDCYPNSIGGLYAMTAPGYSPHLLYQVDADCLGNVSGQLGQMAAVLGSRWLVAFNAMNHGTFVGQGAGLLSFGPDFVPTVTWITSGTGAEERDPVLARVGADLTSDRYLLGWRMQSSGAFLLAIMDAAGAILEGPEVVSPDVQWGARDDSFRTGADGRVTWCHGLAGSSTLQIHTYAEAASSIHAAAPSMAAPILSIFPNPAAGPGLRIRYRLPAADQVTIAVFDAGGRLVRDLRAGRQTAGDHELDWDGLDARGARVAPGVYLCRLGTGGAVVTHKIVVGT